MRIFLDAVNAESMRFTNDGPVFIEHPRSAGYSVRLVKDAESGEGIQDVVVSPV